MLTITRKEKESIIIEVGEEKIEVIVVDSRRRHSVRLAIKASDNVNIIRKELLENNNNKEKENNNNKEKENNKENNNESLK